MRQNLIPYERKLSDYEQKKFEEWIGEIVIHLPEDKYTNTALSEWYLPGYYMQMEYMKQAFRKNTEDC
ncbi:MAG: hypothetical protein K2O99_05005 [Lachnospiraceae bacterium]|nr:hypothetical protein [Lachnospiraceae bacterium]